MFTQRTPTSKVSSVQLHAHINDSTQGAAIRQQAPHNAAQFSVESLTAASLPQADAAAHEISTAAT